MKFETSKWEQSLFTTVFYYFQFLNKGKSSNGFMDLRIPAIISHLPLLDGSKSLSLSTSILTAVGIKVPKLIQKPIKEDILLEYTSLISQIDNYISSRLIPILEAYEQKGDWIDYLYNLVNESFGYSYTPILPNEKPHIVYSPPYKHDLYNNNVFIQIEKRYLFPTNAKKITKYQTKKYYLIDVPESLYIMIIPKTPQIQVPDKFKQAKSDEVFTEEDLEILIDNLDNLEE